MTHPRVESATGHQIITEDASLSAAHRHKRRSAREARLLILFAALSLVVALWASSWDPSKPIFPRRNRQKQQRQQQQQQQGAAHQHPTPFRSRRPPPPPPQPAPMPIPRRLQFHARPTSPPAAAVASATISPAIVAQRAPQTFTPQHQPVLLNQATLIAKNDTPAISIAAAEQHPLLTKTPSQLTATATIKYDPQPFPTGRYDQNGGVPPKTLYR